jgi:hypothetical protein
VGTDLNELQTRLWGVADQLRANSGLRSSEYSTPVLGLIFLRYADERFSEAHAELEGSGSGRRRIEPSDYHARGVLYVPEEARFDALLELPEGADLGKAIDAAMRAVEEANPDLAGVLPRVYAGLPNDVLVELVRLLAPLTSSLDGDGFGLIYEYFLGQFAFAGRDYQLPINFETHAIHGVLADRPWWKVEATDRMVVLDCPLDERWPWRGYVRQVITLDDGVATFEIEVHSDDEPFPASAGWHPWFRRSLTRGGPLEIEIDAESVLALDADGVSSSQRIEIPPQPWDHCFDHVKWPVTLTWPDALRLEVSGDTRYGVVYTELAEAICVEPQTGPPDAPTLEPVIVAPGRPLTATMTWTWTSA